MWQAPVSFLPRVLLEPRRPLLALSVAWATAFVPSLALVAATTVLLPDVGRPQFPVGDASFLWAIIIVAPLLETLIMGAVLLLLRLFLSPTAAVLVSAFAWGVAHSALAPVWGLVVWWPFLVFSTMFLTWRSRSLLAAVAMAAATHALHNSLPALLLVSGLGS